MIVLEHLKEAYIDEMYEWECDPHIQQLVGIEQARTKDVFRQTYDQYITKRHTFLFLFAIMRDGKFVGRLELFIPEQSDVGYIGILIGNKQNRHKGIGKAAMQQLLQHAILRERGVKTLQAEVYEHNEPSISFFKRNGFQEQKMRTKEHYRGNSVSLLQFTYKLQKSSH